MKAIKRSTRKFAITVQSKIQATADKRHINIKLFVVLYVIGVVVFYTGVWILATGSIYLGLTLMGSSYLFDYGYVYVFGKPDWKMNMLVVAYSVVAGYTLSSKVGGTNTLAIIVFVFAVILV